MPSESTIVQLSDGARLKVWMLGDQYSTKPLLIALHGAPGLSSHLEPLEAYEYLTKSCRVLVYDARGSGHSDPKPPFTDERWISDVDELREWAQAKSFILAGGSYGAFLAMGYALAFPNRLSGLILRDAWACGTRGVLRALSSILTSSRISPDPERQVRMWSGNAQGLQDCENGLAEIVTIYTPPNESGTDVVPSFEGASSDIELLWETHNAAFSYSVPRFDVRPRLHEISVPTLVMVGRYDPICPVEESAEIHRLVPNSELVVFERSGHNPPSDEPEKFRNVVDDFLARNVFVQT